MLCNSGDEMEDVANSMVSIDQYKTVTPYKPLTELFYPGGVVKHAVVEIDGQLIVNITEKVLSEDNWWLQTATDSKIQVGFEFVYALLSAQN